RIGLEAIRKPARPGGRRLIIEGAGGVMVPINERDLMLDMMARLDARIVIAAETRLGTINHTLLTVEAVRRRGLDLAGVVMVGEAAPDNREAIEHYGRVRVVGWIPPLPEIDRRRLLGAFADHFDRTAFDA